jgi:phage baseplate assembly protein W
MAYKVQRINPLDLQPRKAIGVSLPFDGRAVFHSTYTSKDAVKSNLINFFLTGKNERFLNLQFGAGLRNFLFENISPESIEQLRLNIIENLKLYFPRVLVQDLKLTPVFDQNLITFTLKYSVSETNINDEISINFQQ